MACSPALPSVLVDPPILASSSSFVPTIRCSQCKTEKPVQAFPKRIVNLRPFQVCLQHLWYWTPAKQAESWAPATTKGVDQVCSEVRDLKKGVEGATDKWMVDGGTEDRAALVQRVATAGEWKSKPLKNRKSEAKSDSSPHPTFRYSLAPLSADDSFPSCLLVLYQHDTEGKYTLTVRPQTEGRSGPWARPDRVRKGKEESGVPAGVGKAASSDKKKSEKGKGKEKAPKKGKEREAVGGKGKGKELQASHSLDVLIDAATAVEGDIVVDAPPNKELDTPRSSQEMPPPPVPLPRPPKKARRVEPSLISSKPISAPPASPSTAPFDSTASTASWSDFLSFPHLLHPPPASQPTLPTAAPFDYSSDQAIMAFLNSLTPSASTSAPLPQANQPLTLADLLANPYFDPPNIPLQPRNQPVASTTSALPTPPPLVPPNAPRISSRVRQSTSSLDLADTAAASSPGPSKAGKELDDAVAAALGASTSSTKRRRGNDEEDEEGEDSIGEESLDEEEGGYYEDSIPDDSSEEGDLQELDEEERSWGSESSAVDTEDDGGGRRRDSDSEDDEDDGGDWLEGFMSRQMPGMSTGTEGDEEEDGRERGDQPMQGVTPRREGDEVDELDELEESAGE
ncbi:hypothetical protein JCM8547_000385 [Rhodosporidiobolus lusitaniae]